jgi:type II secretory pathway pseudopilin PulG
VESKVKKPLHRILQTIIIVFAVIGVLATLAVLSVLWGIYQHEKAYKPRFSYLRLMQLASGFDDYKKQNGAWPADINQLVKSQSGLSEATTDYFGHAVVLTPYSEAVDYGELVSYGRDGKPGGNNKFDRDIVVRFPTETKTNAQWNEQVYKQTRPWLN